jgi:hypothetical protein
MNEKVVGPFPDPPIPDLDESGLMVPPWVKYPNLPRLSMGWRMGAGESYIMDFGVWWSRQAREVRVRFKQKYVEPEAWTGFYARQ